jgi:hypothetical protein
MRLFWDHYEHLKLCAARYVWRRRKEKVPDKSYNWAVWWENKFNDNYREYVDGQKREKEKDKNNSSRA